MAKGLFITFEGGEGTGKSTQIRLFAEYLQSQGHQCLLTREPGGSTGAEEIRALLLKGSTDKWDKTTEMLLFSAARRDHLMKKIWPAIEQGDTVISDRYADSTLAYQGYGYGMDENAIRVVNELYTIVAGKFKPDITFILDLDPTVGVARSQKRTDNDEQRFEAMASEFHHNLRRAFLKIAEADQERCVIINAGGSIDQVHADIVKGFIQKTQC